MKREMISVVLSGTVFLSGCSFLNSKSSQPTTQKESPTSVLYTLSERENEECDVSSYRVKDSAFYDEPKITIDKAELEEYAGSRLDKITESTDTYCVGTYQGYAFTIIRVDAFSGWMEQNNCNDTGDGSAFMLKQYRGNFEYDQLDYYKDPTEHFLIVTQCRDNKVICEFFDK